MEKYIYDESNGLWYERQGDYYLPCLSLPGEEERPIGLWGQRHLRYIREYRKALYTSLQLSGKLNSYLADIDQQAQERLDTIIRQMAEAQGITEALKAADPMAWVSKTISLQRQIFQVICTSPRPTRILSISASTTVSLSSMSILSQSFIYPLIVPMFRLPYISADI